MAVCFGVRLPFVIGNRYRCDLSECRADGDGNRVLTRTIRWAMRQRLTKPHPSAEDAVLQRELDNDPEASPEISKYIALADAALGHSPPQERASRVPNSVRNSGKAS